MTLRLSALCGAWPISSFFTCQCQCHTRLPPTHAVFTPWTASPQQVDEDQEPAAATATAPALALALALARVTSDK